MALPLSTEKGLTRRERKFVKKLAETGSVSQASQLAAYSNKSYGSYLLRQPKILTALQAEMEKQGISDSFLTNKIAEGLEAYYPPRKEGGTCHPDFFTRGQYLDRVLKIRGDFAPEKHEVEHRELTIVINAETIKALLDSGAIHQQEVNELGVMDAEIVPAGTPDGNN